MAARRGRLVAGLEAGTLSTDPDIDPDTEPDTGAAGRHVVLVGFMGAGKSTVGRAVAAALDRPFRDSDEDLEAELGRTGAEVAAAEGVASLHALERRLLLQVLDDDRLQVVAGAGSTAEDPDVRRALSRRAHVVWLDAPLVDLRRRAASGSHRRELSDDTAARLLARRNRAFAAVADLQLDARRPVEESTRAVVALVTTGNARRGTL